MVMNAVVSRFAEHSPVTLMARLVLQKALEPEWLDDLFEQESQTQYTRELLFSTTVELMSLVAVGMRPSLHAAVKSCKDLPVSIQALYDKVRRTEPGTVQALVQASAQRLRSVLECMRPQSDVLVKGWRVKVVDGSHLPATEKRLKPLRGLRVGALPAQSLVIYDPTLDMVLDIIPSEDAHSQERALSEALLERAQAGDLMIADRNFCTRRLLAGWHEHECKFIVREHGSTPAPTALTEMRYIGRVDSGKVHEQRVSIAGNDGQPLSLRRIELHLDQATEEGDTIIGVLTNLPRALMPAQEVAQLYRRRWSIEHMFQRLESVLHSEIASLGHPRAALLAFGVAILAYNVLAILQTAVRCAQDLDNSDIELSPYFFAMEIKANYGGMMVAISLRTWRTYDKCSAQQIARLLLEIAAYVDPQAFRSHARGPKKPKPKGRVSTSTARSHVATARLLAKL